MRRTLPLAAAAATLALAAAGCGSSSNDDKSTDAAASSTMSHSMPATTSGASTANVSDKPADTGAASLRAGLTGLLEDHVYQAGLAVAFGVSDGLDSKTFKAAAGTLDKNSIALSKAIGGVYGD